MARDGLFFRRVGRLNKNHVPAWGLIIQGIWAALLVLPRTINKDGSFGSLYNDLLTYVISAALIFYILTIIGIFLLRRKQPDAEQVGEQRLKRSLGWVSLVALGIGGIIGAGLFIRTAAAIADRAGPSVVLSFVVAGIGCAFAGLCYAEFASMIPVAGSAYTYSYATMGEFVAWIIGWDLILEYAVAAATVSTAWSEYANRVLSWFNMRIPYQWSHSPFEHDFGVVFVILNLPPLSFLLLPP